MKPGLNWILIFLCFQISKADDGYRLWLKYDKIQNTRLLTKYRTELNAIRVIAPMSPVIQSAVQELKAGLQGLLNKEINTTNTNGNGQIRLALLAPTNQENPEAYSIINQNGNIKISAFSDRGLLYGSFALLKAIQTNQSLDKIDLHDAPKIKIRMLNHWDNVAGTIERGYAGSSLWDWYDLPDVIDPRYIDYARANASIGINGTSVNNVNASARFLSKEYLIKVAALADVFRKYGIKTYLSVRWSAPVNLSGLKTADPLDPEVKKWWKEKASEIYKIIPDFGGFLVKANSEGEPGPQDYNRNHADGANMLAEALAPYGGIVIWRAFVYKADLKNDRAAESYNEFKPLDGQFRENVLVQVKNGPIDFQPREPFHPLFGAMPKTPLVMEFQITQEYLGFATHWVYLANMFKEVLESDTYSKGKGSLVSRVIDGSLDNHNLSGIAGVANTGSDRNWTGHTANQANWYAFGRLAWNPDLTPNEIANDWIKMSITNNPDAVAKINSIMMKSHEACVNYMTPLGLHHIMGEGIHFGPQPWLSRSGRIDWTSTYYHKADSAGLGFNRTSSGSSALNTYHPEVVKLWTDEDHIPLHYLLWFHHIPWNKKLATGNTLWQELCARYHLGIAEVDHFIKTWESIKSSIDPETHSHIAGKLKRQRWEAEWWKDACLLYFKDYSKMEIPDKYPKITRSMEEIKELVRLYQLR